MTAAVSAFRNQSGYLPQWQCIDTAALEGARFGFAFASGMAAIDATLRLVKAGEHVVVSDNTYAGPTTISSGVLMIGQGNPGEPGSIVSSVVNNSGALIFNRVEDLTYGGAISGAGTFEKQAAGTLTLTGANTYTGTTTVSAGTLLVNGRIGASSVSVANGTLGGNGIINGCRREFKMRLVVGTK